MVFNTNNIKDPVIKLKKVIHLLATTVVDQDTTLHINEDNLCQIISSEGSKAYLIKHVLEDNKEQLYTRYKDLCAVIILECNPKYKYPGSLATILEMAHFQISFMNNLLSLTDFGKSKDELKVISFLDDLVFRTIRKK